MSKKRKLTEQEKKRLQNITSFLKSIAWQPCCYCKYNFEDDVTYGKYAILYGKQEKETKVYSACCFCEDLETVELCIKWNPSNTVTVLDCEENNVVIDRQIQREPTRSFILSSIGLKE